MKYARSVAGGRSAGQRGFALLFVFLMAACAAILFYMELPRAAFESQRVKEDMLIERGEQYARAIKLYVRKWNKYPANLEELENTNNVRYLRRRYRDPISGKDDWRLIHVGPGGVFTDSLVYDRAKQVQDSDSEKSKSKAEPASAFITSGPAFGSTEPLPGSQDSPASRFHKRGIRQNEKASANEEEPARATPTVARAPDASTTAAPSGGAADPQVGSGSQVLGVMPPAVPPMAPVTPAGAGMTPAASNQALDMIRRILTTPRAGGLAGVQSGGVQITGGLAGVASKVEEEGIKVYNDRSAYHEWEFVYDVRKDAAKATAAMIGGQGAAGAGSGAGPSSGPGTGTGGGTGAIPGIGMPPRNVPGQGR